MAETKAVSWADIKVTSRTKVVNMSFERVIRWKDPLSESNGALLGGRQSYSDKDAQAPLPAAAAALFD